ncbi:MAG: SDR family NAD(P)-dependent oxidoreductase [Nitrospiraceae bacterium]
MKTFMQKYGPWGLVTGASSGMGVEFAQQLAAKGLNLVLVARREERLRDLAARLEKDAGIHTRVVAADLSRDDFLPSIRQAIQGLEVGLLVNNAGFGNTGDLLENELHAELAVLQTNCRAPLMLAHELGQPMRERRKGGMIFVSSIVAFAGAPAWSNYCATKAYKLILAEGLAKELKKDGVDVMALCPGTTRTEFQKVANTRDVMAMDPDVVVRHALEKLGRTNTTVAGLANSLLVFSTRLQPRWLNSTMFGMAVQRMRAH